MTFNNQYFERVWAQQEYIRTYIGQADTKSSIGIVSTSALTVWSAKIYLIAILQESTPVMWKLLFFSVLFSGGLSVVFFTLALWPRLGSLRSRGHFFFNEVATYTDVDGFKAAYKELSDEDFCSEVVESIYYSSRICRRKFQWIRRGIILALISIVLIILSFLVAPRSVSGSEDTTVGVVYWLAEHESRTVCREYEI